MGAKVLILPISRYAYACREFKDADKPVKWLYLGKDFSSALSLSSRMPPHFTRIRPGRLHDEIADRIRKEFITWLDRLNDLWGDDNEWWFESLSSRSVYESGLFQNCCYIEVIRELCARGRSSIPDVIFVDSESLASILSDILEKSGIKNVFRRYLFAGAFIKRSILTLYNYFFFVCQLLCRVICSVLTYARRRRKNILPGSPKILIDAFIHPDSFRGDGSFSDPYYRELYPFLISKGYGIMIHPVLDISSLDFFPVYNGMSKSNYNFLVPEDYLRLSDFAGAVLYPFRYSKRRIVADPFLGTDIMPLIKEERMFPSFSSPMLAILVYRSILRLKNHAPEPEIAINRYENQVVDRALILGIREAFPKTKIMGAQMFMHCLNMLNIFPTMMEQKHRIVPDVVLCTSQLQCDMAKSFATGLKCLPCAALRYSHVFDDVQDGGPLVAEKNILVLLPYIHDEALEILYLLKEALGILGQDMSIRIKNHPLLDMKALRLKYGKWPGEICDKSLKEELSTASVVVGFETGSLIEALASGKPVIFVARQNGFSQNPLVDFPEGSVRVCYSPSELAEALAHYHSLSMEERSSFRSQSRRVRDLYFTPISNETLEPFLG